MHLKNIQIKNFRKFESIEVDFSPSFNLLVGENGTGKTTILEAVRIALGGFLSGFGDVKVKHFSNDEVQRRTIVYDGDKRIAYILPIEVCAKLKFKNKEFTFTRQKRKMESSRSTTNPLDIVHYAEKISKDESAIFPLICYQGISRIAAQKKEKRGSDVENLSRTAGYIDCLESESNLKMITNWFSRMDHISLQKGEWVKTYESVIYAIEVFMQHILNEKDSGSVRYDAILEEIVYESHGQSLPLRFLSSGFRTLIGIVLDIAYRMAVLNPALGRSVAKETDGIVLIDELDMHLHPQWQWRVIEAMKATFPKVQFIATTHSPQIISSVKDDDRIISFENFAVGRDIKPEYLDHVNGWRVGDILKARMKSEPRSPEVVEKLNRLRKLGRQRIDKNISKDEESEFWQIVQDLTKILPENDIAIEEAGYFSIEDILRKDV